MVPGGDWWQGVVGSAPSAFARRGTACACGGRLSDAFLRSYLRLDDDLEAIYRGHLQGRLHRSRIIDRFRGMRLIRQDVWECSASYLLASYSNVPRIKKMIEALCRTYGRRLSDGQYTFPTPEEMAEGTGDIGDVPPGLSRGVDQGATPARSGTGSSTWSTFKGWSTRRR